MSRDILDHSWKELPYPFVIEAESKYENEFFVVRDIIDYAEALATIVSHRLCYYDRDQIIIINNAFSDRNNLMRNLENFLNSTSKSQYEGIRIHKSPIDSVSPLNDLEQKVKVYLSN